MLLKTFSKGMHLPEQKFTASYGIEVMLDPLTVAIPLKQHIGVECKPLVSVGDKVDKYQKIGDNPEGLCAPVHASISGIVKEIRDQQTPSGTISKCIVISSEDEKLTRTKIFSKRTLKEAESLSKEDIVKIMKESGIVGMGGAGFPTYAKYSSSADVLVINGAECEPMITSDDVLMKEYSEKILRGVSLMIKASGAKKAVIGIENNKKKAIKEMMRQAGLFENIYVKPLKTKYPQGAEKMLVYSLTGRKVPCGNICIDVGVIVNNVATAKAVYDAVYLSKPLVERVVTVTGDVSIKKNVLVPIGTSIKEIIDFCGQYISKPEKIIVGGPMMGVAQKSDNVPITKTSNAIIVIKNIESYTRRNCIRCGRCIMHCPMNLMPKTIAEASDKREYTIAENNGAMECFECGLCSYVCPSKIPLTQLIKDAKRNIALMKTKDKNG